MSDKKTKQTENSELTFDDNIKLIKALNGIAGNDREPPPDDQEYAIFTAGEHAERGFRRIAKPPQSAAREVAALRVRKALLSESIKEAICQEWGWDTEEKISDDLSRYDFQQKVLPLICREVPKNYEFDDTNGAEIDRMLNDFLLGT